MDCGGVDDCLGVCGCRCVIGYVVVAFFGCVVLRFWFDGDVWRLL